MTVREAFDLFMYEQRVRNNAASTLEYYKTFLGEFIEWLDVDIVDNLTINEYRDYIIYLSASGIKSTSINTKVRAVKAFYNFLIDNDQIGDCSRKLKLIKQKREEIIILTDDEINTLLSCFDLADTIELRNKCIVLLMLDCGLRRAETTRILVKDIDFKQRTVLVNGKGDKQRIVPLGSSTCEHLQKYAARFADRKPGSPFFLDRFGNAIDTNVIDCFFVKLKADTGIQRLRPHLLRHTFATLYLIDGGNLEVLRIIMGHSSIAITQLYLHLAANYKLINSRYKSHIDQLGTP